MFGLGSSLVNSSLSQSIGNRQAEERLNANQAANGLFGIGAAKAYWGSGPGTPFLDVGGGGGGGGNSWQNAWDAARRANEQRYGIINKGYDNLFNWANNQVAKAGGIEGTRLAQQYDNQRGRADSSLANGAFNTTVRSNLQSGIGRDESDAFRGLAQSIGQTKAGVGVPIIENKLNFDASRNDNYPDLGMMAQLFNQYGNGGDGGGDGSPLFGNALYQMPGGGMGGGGGWGWPMGGMGGYRGRMGRGSPYTWTGAATSATGPRSDGGGGWGSWLSGIGSGIGSGLSSLFGFGGGGEGSGWLTQGPGDTFDGMKSLGDMRDNGYPYGSGGNPLTDEDYESMFGKTAGGWPGKDRAAYA